MCGQGAKDQIAEIVARISDTCLQGTGFEQLTSTFRGDAVMVQPDFSAKAIGRQACLKNYEDACSQMKFDKFDTSDVQVELFDNTAVFSHHYDCIWEFKGKRLTDDGREVFVFVKDETGWKVAWRTVIPGTRQVETPAVDQAQTGRRQDVRETCRHLLTTLPVRELTTLDVQGYPHTTAMLNLRCAKAHPNLVDLHAAEKNDFCIHLTTANQSAKMVRLKANPKVSLFFCDADHAIGFMLGGDIEVIEDQALKERIWQDGWTMYYPNGPQGPEYGVLKLAPKIAKGRCRDQSFVIEMES